MADQDPWWVSWARDMDNDRVDDELEIILDNSTTDAKIRVIVNYNHRPNGNDLQDLNGHGVTIVYVCKYIDSIIIETTAGMVSNLLSIDTIVMLEADLRIERTLDSALRSVHMDVVRSNWSYDGEGITIGIVDTGVDTKHMGLDDLDDNNDTADPKVIAFYDAKNHPDVLDGTYPPYDDDGHGSHVSGISAGTGAGSKDYIYAGVAPGAHIVGIKVLGPNDNSMSDAMRGLEWARDNKARYGIRILSLSFGAIFSGGGTNDGTSSISRLCDSLVEDGLIVVVAAGNSGPRRRTIAPPGDAKQVITVGNTNDDHSLNPSSSRGPVGGWNDNYIKPDICAPGTDINSVKANSVNNYTSMTGTSMSTPFVSGIVAVMLQIDTSMSPPQVKQMLQSTAGGESASVVGGSPNNDYGFGIIRPLDIITNLTNGKKPPQVTVDEMHPIVRGTAKITGSAMSDAGRITAVEVWTGSGDWQAADGYENWEFKWDTRKAPNGNIELRFRAYDGNLYSVLTRRYLTVNNIQVNVTLPDRAVFSGNATIKGTVNGYIIKQVEAKIDNGAWTPVEDTSPNRNWANWEYSFNTKNLKGEKHTFVARAYDGYEFTDSSQYTFYLPKEKDDKLKITPGFDGTMLLVIILFVISLSMGKKGRFKDRRSGPN